MPTLLNILRPLLHLDQMTVTGRTLGDELDRCPAPFPQNIVRPLDNPLSDNSSIVVLNGNLAPDGCVLKASAMASHLRTHAGPAVVFTSTADLAKRIDDPNLEVTEDSVCVLPKLYLCYLTIPHPLPLSISLFSSHPLTSDPACSSKTSGPSATPACPKRATSPSPKNSRRGGQKTCSASPTAACPAPPPGP